MNIKKVAKISNVSVRTLQYYDKIGLLSPKRNKDNQYRQYCNNDLDKLQHILFFKQCGFSLKEIQKILESKKFDKLTALELQKKQLQFEKNRIDKMINTLDKSIKQAKGELNMKPQEKFEGLDFTHNPYEQEAKKLWGENVVTKASKHIKSLDNNGKQGLSKEMHELFESLATVMTYDANSQEAQNKIHDMYNFFNSSFGIHYSLDAFEGLGQTYVNDSRFKKNIDKYADGLSDFLCNAMRIYARSHR